MSSEMFMLMLSLIVVVGASNLHKASQLSIDDYLQDGNQLNNTVTNILPKVNERFVCRTVECHEFASKIEENMNKSADPCVDFYEYACGRWEENNPIPTDQNFWSVQSIVQNQVKDEIREILSTDPQPDDIRPVQQVKKWYTACMDIDSIEARGVQPLLSILSNIGGWPMITSSDQGNSEYNWQNVDDYYAHLTGKNLLHEVRVTSHSSCAAKKCVVLDNPDLPAASWVLNGEVDDDEEEIEDEANRHAYEGDHAKINMTGNYAKFALKVVLAIAQAGRVNVSIENVVHEIDQMLHFQYKLGKLTYLMDDPVNMTLGSFQKWYDGLRGATDNSKVNWLRKVVQLFHRAGVDVDDKLDLKVVSPEYFSKLILLLNSTPQRTVVNYLHWVFVSSMVIKTTKEMRTSYNNLTLSEEAETQDTRSENCIMEMEMDDIVGYEYVKKHFLDDTIDHAMGMLDDIQEEIKVQIEKSTWADETIKRRTLNKILKIKRLIGYPKWYNNATVMDGYFKELSIGPTYFENVINYKKYVTMRTLHELVEDGAPENWLVNSATINAVYMYSSNSITVPAANFRKPFFSSARPNVINYALVGFLMSHEMSHAFDNERRVYDENANKVTWSQEMTIEYNKRVQCFVDQFDNYTLNDNGDKIENYGNETKEENISDTVGLQAVYRAYLRRRRLNGEPEQVLPALENFTSDELFFLTFANLWCSATRSEFVVKLAKLNPHATPRLRLIGSLSNTEDFAKAYNCSLSSPMNPDKKCNIWK